VSSPPVVCLQPLLRKEAMQLESICSISRLQLKAFCKCLCVCMCWLKGLECHTFPRLFAVSYIQDLTEVYLTCLYKSQACNENNTTELNVMITHSVDRAGLSRTFRLVYSHPTFSLSLPLSVSVNVINVPIKLLEKLCSSREFHYCESFPHRMFQRHLISPLFSLSGHSTTKTIKQH